MRQIASEIQRGDQFVLLEQLSVGNYLKVRAMATPEAMPKPGTVGCCPGERPRETDGSALDGAQAARDTPTAAIFPTVFLPAGHSGGVTCLYRRCERERPRRCRAMHRQPMAGGRALRTRVARLVSGLGLLLVLVSVADSGCGISRPPVMTPEQWEAEYKRVQSRGD